MIDQTLTDPSKYTRLSCFSIEERMSIVEFYHQKSDYNWLRKTFSKRFLNRPLPSNEQISFLVQQFIRTGSLILQSECISHTCEEHNLELHLQNQQEKKKKYYVKKKQKNTDATQIDGKENHQAPVKKPKPILKNSSENIINPCEVCHEMVQRPDQVLCSNSYCRTRYHAKCLGIYSHNKIFNKFKCFKCCQSAGVNLCHVCRGNHGSIIKCNIADCNLWYHLDCLDKWPQSTRSENEIIVCPIHCCHTCSSIALTMNDIAYAKASPFTKCRYCPSTYHTDMSCMPAGTKLLSIKENICIKHLSRPKKKERHVDWCLICNKGEDLLLCQECPASFHSTCINVYPSNEESFTCDDCIRGRFPVYGEMTWAKVSPNRWWPCIIQFPHEIPEDMCKPEIVKGRKICLKFINSNTYMWSHRNQIYVYKLEDSESPFAHNDGGHSNYANALLMATKMFKDQFMSPSDTSKNKQTKSKTTLLYRNEIDAIKPTNTSVANINEDSNDSSKDLSCKICNEEWGKSTVSKSWLQCLVCLDWDHEFCISKNYPNSIAYICQDCDNRQKP